METSKIVAYSAIGFSAMSMLACIILVPTMYEQINQLHDDIMTEMQDFQVGTRVGSGPGGKV